MYMSSYFTSKNTCNRCNEGGHLQAGWRAGRKGQGYVTGAAPGNVGRH